VSPSSREREYARRRYEEWAARSQERAAARRRARRNALVAIAAVASVLAVVVTVTLLARAGGDPDTVAAGSSPSDGASAAPSVAGSATGSPSAAASPAANPCPTPSARPAGDPRSFPRAPDASLAEGRTWKLTLATSCGPVEITLDGAKAPKAVANAIFLSREKFWDGSPCHRLTTSGIYVLQCGDPTGSGSGGPGYQFGPVENAPPDAVYPAGTVAMARAASPDSQGSQFFLVYRNSTIGAPGQPGYTVVGRITKGLDIVRKVAQGGVGGRTGDGAPLRPVSLVSSTVSPG
jgi:peptidyl-prolyl cis-trans isomerase B (cyclophilin B)